MIKVGEKSDLTQMRREKETKTSLSINKNELLVT